MAEAGLGAVRIELDRVELEIAWQRSNLPALPATLCTLAVAEPEPAARAEAAERLRARALLGPHGELNPDLRQLLGVLSGAPFEIELRYTDGRMPGLRAAATVRGGVVVIGVLSGDRVVLRRLPGNWADDAAGAALVGLLPRERPANGTSVSLPVTEVDRAIVAALDEGHELDAGLVKGLTDRGVAPVDALMFAGLTSRKRLRTALFGITVRDRQGIRHRSTNTVRVIDTERGRAILSGRGDYLVATPADDRTLTRALAELRESEPARG